jgi:uncharacterized protein YkwD
MKWLTIVDSLVKSRFFSPRPLEENRVRNAFYGRIRVGFTSFFLAAFLFTNCLHSHLLFGAENEKNSPVEIRLRATVATLYKDLKIPEASAVPFRGGIPIAIDGVKPTCRIAENRIYVSTGALGQVDYKDGSIWHMRAVFPDQVRESYRWLVNKQSDGWTLRSLETREGRFEGTRFVLVDADSNGRFDGVGADWVVFEQGPRAKVGEAFEWNGKKLRLDSAPSGTKAFIVSATAPGTVQVLAADEQKTSGTSDAQALDFGGKKFGTDVDGALNAWNSIRNGLGLQPVTRDVELEKNGYKHIEYMRLHGMTHYQDKKKEGYSPEGEKSGKGSNLSMGTPDAKAMMLGLLDTFFHRVAMIKPDLAVSGISYDAESRYGVINVFDGKRNKVAWTEPIPYPPPNAQNVRPSWSGNEGPSPIPESPPKGGVGQTVTLTFSPKTKVVEVKMVLKEDQTEIAAWVTTPENPAPAGKSMFPTNMDTICLIAKSPLKPNTRYSVEVSAKVNGAPFAKTWTFATGEVPTPNWVRKKK